LIYISLIRLSQCISISIKCSFWNPNNKVLASTDEHAIYMGELDTSYSTWMEFHQLQFTTCFYIPKYYLLIVWASYHIFRIRSETCLERSSGLIEIRSKFIQL